MRAISCHVIQHMNYYTHNYKNDKVIIGYVLGGTIGFLGGVKGFLDTALLVLLNE